MTKLAFFPIYGLLQFRERNKRNDAIIVTAYRQKSYCSEDSFYRAANAIFGRIWRIATEEVVSTANQMRAYLVIWT